MNYQVQVKVNLPAISRTIKRQAHPQIEKATFELREILVEQFSGVKTGRIYRRPAGGSYQASAPGESPAIRSGDLLRSISQPRFPALNIGQIIIAAPYARRLEHGTAKMAARPFVDPAIRTLIQRWNGGRL